MEINITDVIPPNLPFRTPETEAWYKDNYKQYWLDTELVPSEKTDTQTDFIIKTLHDQLDIDKIETVLEVGVGYGRVARGILDTFPHIDLYYGIDLSNLAIEQSKLFLDDHKQYRYNVGDFDEMKFFRHRTYDLVISTATLSTLPTDEQAFKWLDKMISLSKKYVVTVDFHEDSDSDIVFNNGRNYNDYFYKNRNIIQGTRTFDIPDYKNERLYIVRVK